VNATGGQTGGTTTGGTTATGGVASSGGTGGVTATGGEAMDGGLAIGGQAAGGSLGGGSAIGGTSAGQSAVGGGRLTQGGATEIAGGTAGPPDAGMGGRPDAGTDVTGTGGARTGGQSGTGGVDAGADGAGSSSADGADTAAADAAGCVAPSGGTLTSSTTHLDIGVHDPSMIWDGKLFYLFGTGGQLSIRASANGLQWSNAGQVFTAQPAWIAAALGSAPADLWAPDVSYFSCRYHVYYAGSTFGTNSSVIGLATNVTLDATSPNYQWIDQGLVVQSKSTDNFNAIDPNVAFDEVGNPWLAFGSFWSGIKLRKLDAGTGKLSTSDTTMYSIAGRNGGAIEAPSIISHNGYYYLFVSFDKCCAGVSSTYRTMAGRASKITGPYASKAGAAMTEGGADQMLATQGRTIGPGGGTAWQNGSNYYYSFHYYDGQDNGVSKLQIRPITFASDNWPILGDPIFP
jgi:arabinan endo-1,5-alpha-L-arabinosidase